MSKKNVELFVKYLLNSNNLDQEQRKAVSRLLTRDSGSVPSVQESIKTLSDFKSERHNTETIFRFLHLFGEKDALKYTTHTWEHSPGTEDFKFKDFETFKKRYSDILNEWKDKILILGNTELWMLIQNFLLNDDTQFYWGEDKIRVGYNKYLAKWMDNNPGNQPFSMPLSEFPESIRPSVINKRSLNSFNDVVEIFKHSIEFRDNDLYNAIKRIFKNKSFRINREKLATIQGVTFYTHTQKIKNALEIIAGNIFNRAEFPDFEVSCTTKTGKEKNTIQLEILQLDSYSNKDVNDPKVLGIDPNGDIASIKNLLRNLCDFSVVSRFKQDDEFKYLRINYLVSDSRPGYNIEVVNEYDCKGFKYILTFYTYNQ